MFPLQVNILRKLRFVPEIAIINIKIFLRFTKYGVEHFPWVQPDSDDEEEEKNLRAKELFMSGDSTMVTVGGG